MTRLRWTGTMKEKLRCAGSFIFDGEWWNLQNRHSLRRQSQYTLEGEKTCKVLIMRSYMGVTVMPYLYRRANYNCFCENWRGLQKTVGDRQDDQDRLRVVLPWGRVHKWPSLASLRCCVCCWAFENGPFTTRKSKISDGKIKSLTNSLVAKFSDGIREEFQVFHFYISLTNFCFFSSGCMGRSPIWNSCPQALTVFIT